jgi:hypothetical protein
MMLLEWGMDQLPTRILSSLAPIIVETTLLPPQVTNVEIPNEEFEVSAINLLNALQVCTYHLTLIQMYHASKKSFFDFKV